MKRRDGSQCGDNKKKSAGCVGVDGGSVMCFRAWNGIQG